MQLYFSKLLGLGLLAALLCSCGSPGKGKEKATASKVPYYNGPDFSPYWLAPGSDSARLMHQVAPFSLLTQQGDTLHSGNLEGKIYVANFFFTSCGSICPKMTANLKKVQEIFPSNPLLKILSFSVTPWIDSVPRLQWYAKKHEIKGEQWYLLTGDKSRIYQLARQEFYAEEEPGMNKDSTEFLHTEHMILVDREGHLRGLYNGTLELEIEHLVEDIRILLQEK